MPPLMTEMKRPSISSRMARLTDSGRQPMRRAISLRGGFGLSSTLPATGRPLLEQREEGGPCDAEHLRAFDGDGGRRSGLPIDERQLAHHFIRSEVANDRLAAIGIQQRDADAAFQHDHEVVARVTFIEQCAAFRIPAGVRALGQSREVGGWQIGEPHNPSQDGGGIQAHGARLYPRSGRRWQAQTR